MRNRFHINDLITFNSQPKRRLGAAVFGLSILLVTGLLAACGASTPTPASLPTSASTMPPLPTTLPTSAGAMPVTGSSLDPCQLITSQEASVLAGTTFGEGEAETDTGGTKRCVYGANTTNVFTVEVVQAPDLATVQTAKAQFMAELQASIPQAAANGLVITQLPNLGDGAVMGQANLAAINVNGGAIGVTKGTIFFGFSDLVQGGPAPTSQALQAEITKVLGKLP